MQANFTAIESLASLFCLDIVARYFSSKTWFNRSINSQSTMRLVRFSYMSDRSPCEFNLECKKSFSVGFMMLESMDEKKKFFTVFKLYLIIGY